MGTKNLPLSDQGQQLTDTPITKDITESISNKAQLARDIAFLEALLAAQNVKDIAHAVPRPTETLSNDLLGVPGSTLGKGSSGRRIGGSPSGTETANDGTGFDDPLAGQRNRRRGSLVGPGKMPSQGDLVGQYTETSPDSDTQSHDGSSGRPARHQSVRVERHTERTSPNGLDTWGSTLYRDDSGNHWRSDQHVHRGEDGSVTTTDTIYGANGEPIKTTVVAISPYGVETETHTNHQTGETTTRDITPKVAPEPAPKIDKYQPDGDSPRGDPIAPRGWSNPVTGVTQNPGLATGNNQVNPGPEESPPPLEPLRLDPKDLVINPLPDAQTGHATPRDIRREEAGINEVDPPRPVS